MGGSAHDMMMLNDIGHIDRCMQPRLRFRGVPVQVRKRLRKEKEGQFGARNHSEDGGEMEFWEHGEKLKHPSIV